MKRVIKASTFTRNFPLVNEYYGKFKSAKDDAEYLSKCKTLEDVTSHKYQLFNVDNLIGKLRHVSADQQANIIEKEADDWEDFADYAANQYLKASKHVKLFESYVSKLKRSLNINLEDTYARIPKGNGNPLKLTNLVDIITAELDADYYGTSKGGSWTAYNIVTPDGVELQIGRIDPVKDSKDFGMQIVGI